MPYFNLMQCKKKYLDSYYIQLFDATLRKMKRIAKDDTSPKLDLIIQINSG